MTAALHTTAPTNTPQPHTLSRLIRNWRILNRPFWPLRLTAPTSGHDHGSTSGRHFVLRSRPLCQPANLSTSPPWPDISPPHTGHQPTANPPHAALSPRLSAWLKDSERTSVPRLSALGIRRSVAAKVQGRISGPLGRLVLRPPAPATSHQPESDQSRPAPSPRPSASPRISDLCPAEAQGVVSGLLRRLAPRLPTSWPALSTPGRVDASDQPTWPVVRLPGSRPPAASHEPTPSSLEHLVRRVLGAHPSTAFTKAQERIPDLLARLVSGLSRGRRPVVPDPSHAGASNPPSWPVVRSPNTRSLVPDPSHEATSESFVFPVPRSPLTHRPTASTANQVDSLSSRTAHSPAVLAPSNAHATPDPPARPVPRSACIRLLPASTASHEHTSPPLAHPLTRPPIAPQPLSTTVTASLRLRLGAS